MVVFVAQQVVQLMRTCLNDFRNHVYQKGASHGEGADTQRPILAKLEDVVFCVYGAITHMSAVMTAGLPSAHANIQCTASGARPTAAQMWSLADTATSRDRLSGLGGVLL